MQTGIEEIARHPHGIVQTKRLEENFPEGNTGFTGLFFVVFIFLCCFGRLILAFCFGSAFILARRRLIVIVKIADTILQKCLFFFFFFFFVPELWQF